MAVPWPEGCRGGDAEISVSSPSVGRPALQFSFCDPRSMEPFPYPNVFVKLLPRAVCRTNCLRVISDMRPAQLSAEDSTHKRAATLQSRIAWIWNGRGCVGQVNVGQWIRILRTLHGLCAGTLQVRRATPSQKTARPPGQTRSA